MPTPRHEPTDQTRGVVKSMVAYGMHREDIARSIGITQPTLRKYYAEELETGAAEANAMVGQFIYKLASGKALKEGATWADCSRQAMFWAKTRMGWRETDRLEVTGKDGDDIKVAAQIDYTQLSTAALKELEGVLAKDDPSTDNGRSAADQE